MNLLSAKGTRRLGRELGLPTITRAWAAVTGPLVIFATWDHEHADYDRSTGSLFWQKDAPAHQPECFDADGSLLVELDPFDDDGRWPTLND